MKEIREARLLECRLNGMPMVWFSRHTEDTETTWTSCFETEEEALREIGLFKEGLKEVKE